ncbi:MAG: hypothetical protein SCALA702_21820 [Melioribacteraceae bacterium]|nr:MAG: hypothetical protein SCALA702_21820 [Melioribacteraceae bacterium]
MKEDDCVRCRDIVQKLYLTLSSRRNFVCQRQAVCVTGEGNKLLYHHEVPEVTRRAAQLV